MAKSNNSYIKKQKADKRAKTRREKLQKKVEKKDSSSGGELDNMIAYVDKFGNITSEPPIETPDEKEEVE
jgi:S-adenosylmethionine hydrolase